MKFPCELLLTGTELDEGEIAKVDGRVIEMVKCPELSGTSRWSILYSWVFKYEGKFYASTYSVGATEMQDEGPYEYERRGVECTEVQPFEVTVIEWRPVKECREQG